MTYLYGKSGLVGTILLIALMVVFQPSSVSVPYDKPIPKKREVSSPMTQEDVKYLLARADARAGKWRMSFQPFWAMSGRPQKKQLYTQLIVVSLLGTALWFGVGTSKGAG